MRVILSVHDSAGAMNLLDLLRGVIASFTHPFARELPKSHVLWTCLTGSYF